MGMSFNRSTCLLVVVALLCMNAFAEIEVAQNYDDVTRFLEENQDDTVALLFMDSTASSQSSGGVFSGIFSSIGSIFSGSGDSGSSDDQVAQIEKEISDEAALMQIDVSMEDLKEIQESYDVTQVPFLIVFKRGIVVLKEVPDKETHDEILQVMNVTPASQRAEAEASTDDTTVEAEASAETTPEAEAAEPAAAEEATPAEEAAPADEETVVKPISVRQAPPSPRPAPRPAPTIVEPISVAQPKPKPSLKEPEKSFATGEDVDEGANTGAPRSFELMRGPVPPPAPVREEQKPTTQEKVTLAPGESQETDSSAQEIPASKPARAAPQPAAKPEAKAAPAKKEREHVDPDSRRKYVYHKCHEMGTHNDCEPLDWRTNPYYIPELEDYEVPEDWWRNGYAPITDGNNDADNRTKCERENCRVPPPPVDFVPPEPHVYHVPEPVHVAHIPEPVHVAHVPEPVHVAHVPEARVVEAPVRVAQAPVRPAVVAEPAPRFVGKKYTGRNATVTTHEVPTQGPVRTVRGAGPTPVVGPAPVVSERVVGPRLGGNVHTSRPTSRPASRPTTVKTSTTTKPGKR